MPQFSLSSWGLRNDRFDYSRTFSGVWVSNTWCHSSWCRASLSIMFPSLSFISTTMYQSYRRYRRYRRHQDDQFAYKMSKRLIFFYFHYLFGVMWWVFQLYWVKSEVNQNWFCKNIEKIDHNSFSKLIYQRNYELLCCFLFRGNTSN